jgi:hypothetical protein
MTRSNATALCLLLFVASLRPAQLSAQTPSDLAGTWALNRQLSQFPSELGFSADFLGALGPGAGPVSGGRGRAAVWARQRLCVNPRRMRSESCC